jgi:hypothetical protein
MQHTIVIIPTTTVRIGTFRFMFGRETTASKGKFNIIQITQLSQLKYEGKLISSARRQPLSIIIDVCFQIKRRVDYATLVLHVMFRWKLSAASGLVRNVEVCN